MSNSPTVFAQAFFHGTRADLVPGDLIEVGHPSNFTDGSALSWVYFTSTLDPAIWGAELAIGEGAERIYVVETTGDMENDPNLTDQRFPGNPSMSYRSRAPLRVVAEATGWHGHPPEQIRRMKEGLAQLKAAGAYKIID